MVRAKLDYRLGKKVLCAIGSTELLAISKTPIASLALEATYGAGSITAARAFMELSRLQKEIRKAEDRILELMGESEPLEGNVKKAEVALKEEKQLVEGEKTLARERTAADQAQLKQLQAERIEAAAQLPKATLTEYERIRKKWHGVVIAEATSGRCAACQIVLRPQYLQDLKKGDHLMTCESCGRFLYYNPPVRVEMTPTA